MNAALWDDQKTSGGCNRRDGATKAVRKLLRGKWNLGGLQYGGGGGFGHGRKAPPPPSARPQCAPPRPGALRAAAWPWGSRARAVPFGTERGGWGEGRSQGSEPCWGREGGATPWEKGLGTSRADQSASKAWVASRGSFGQWEGRTLRRFGGRKGKKKPHETTIESVWGLGRRGVGVVNVMFPCLSSPWKDGRLASLYCCAAQKALRRVRESRPGIVHFGVALRFGEWVAQRWQLCA